MPIKSLDLGPKNNHTAHMKTTLKFEKTTIRFTKGSLGTYYADRRDLPSTFDGCTPLICAPFVRGETKTEPVRIKITLSSQPFKGGKQIYIDNDWNCYYHYGRTKDRQSLDFYSETNRLLCCLKVCPLQKPTRYYVSIKPTK